MVLQVVRNAGPALLSMSSIPVSRQPVCRGPDNRASTRFNRHLNKRRICMPNFSSLFKEEVTRLARRQVRQEVESLKKASGQYRRDIAALKREVARLSRQASRGERARSVAQSAADKGPDTKIRFVAKGLKAQRERPGLPAAEYAKLADVSRLSIYNWESGPTRPRAEQIAVLASLRALGRKPARARLEQLDRK